MRALAEKAVPAALAALALWRGSLLCATAWAADPAVDPFAPETAPREGIGLLNIIIIAFAVYVLWRAFSRRPGGHGDDDKATPPTYTVTPEDDRKDDRAESKAPPKDLREARAKAAWDYLSSEPPKRPSNSAQDRTPESESVPLPDAASPGDSAGVSAPPGFNQAEFLRGAKAMYARIRDSWARRDLNDLRQFAAPDMMAQFERWAAENPTPGEIVIMLVDARLLEVKADGSVTIADVAYEATVSDSPASREPKKISEIWRFSEDADRPDATWLLEKIEQKQ